MNKNLALKVAGIVFTIVAIIHVVRLYYQTPIMVDGTTIPMQVSIYGLIIALALAWWMFKASKN